MKNFCLLKIDVQNICTFGPKKSGFDNEEKCEG